MVLWSANSHCAVWRRRLRPARVRASAGELLSTGAAPTEADRFEAARTGTQRDGCPPLPPAPVCPAARQERPLLAPCRAGRLPGAGHAPPAAKLLSAGAVRRRLRRMSSLIASRSRRPANFAICRIFWAWSRTELRWRDSLSPQRNRSRRNRITCSGSAASALKREHTLLSMSRVNSG